MAVTKDDQADRLKTMRQTAAGKKAEKDAAWQISENHEQEKLNPSDPKLNAHNQEFWGPAPSTFSKSEDPEPHVLRRRELINKYPEDLKQLPKYDPAGAVFCVATIIFQFFMAYMVRDASWPTILVLGYFVSGTCNHSLVLAMHELSHDLMLPYRWMNISMGVASNLPLTISAFGTFKRYHLEHHSFQGSDKWDADIPTSVEGKIFTNWFTKMIWVFLQPAFYGLRPCIVKPKKLTTLELVGWVVVITSNLLVVKFLGGKALAYLFSGSILGLGMHPMSGHFVAEHFEFVPGQETYSYYGPLNYIAYNVGYHNEHHDFPNVPGRFLPKITKIAPEYYLNKPHYNSWCRVVFDFIFSPKINCFSRIKRKPWAE